MPTESTTIAQKKQALKNNPAKLREFEEELVRADKFCAFVLDNIETLAYDAKFKAVEESRERLINLKNVVKNTFRGFKNTVNGSNLLPDNKQTKAKTYMDFFKQETIVTKEGRVTQKAPYALEALYLYQHFYVKVPGTGKLGQELLSKSYSKAMQTVSGLKAFQKFKSSLDEVTLVDWLLTNPGPFKMNAEAEKDEKSIQSDNVFKEILENAQEQFRNEDANGPTLQFDDGQTRSTQQSKENVITNTDNDSSKPKQTEAQINFDPELSRSPPCRSSFRAEQGFG